LIALDAATGKPCEDFGLNGQVDLSEGVDLGNYTVDRTQYGVTSPPVVIGDLVVIGSAIGDNRAKVQMPALTRFADGTGPIFAGGIFPFCFITIACGAVSGFHSLISSGTTPKMIMRETQARMIGYGSMLLESAITILLGSKRPVADWPPLLEVATVRRPLRSRS